MFHTPSSARDLKQLTGIYIDPSTQQRLVHRQEFVEILAEQTVTGCISLLQIYKKIAKMKKLVKQ